MTSDDVVRLPVEARRPVGVQQRDVAQYLG